METRTDRPDDAELLQFFHAIATRDVPDVARRIESAPGLAQTAIRVAATRDNAGTYFLTAIRHYVYGGDTALHIAAAAHEPTIATAVVARGAAVRARNRRGAEPLHYAADGAPNGEHWDPVGQRGVVEYLIAAGADPNACDNSGVAPLHRAVRTRCSEVVRALIENGADPRIMNKRGSTPLHLAVQNTGRSNSGTGAAKDEQRRIIGLLLQHGASPADVDAAGKTVAAAASAGWVRDLLDTT